MQRAMRLGGWYVSDDALMAARAALDEVRAAGRAEDKIEAIGEYLAMYPPRDFEDRFSAAGWSHIARAVLSVAPMFPAALDAIGWSYGDGECTPERRDELEALSRLDHSSEEER